MENQGEQTPALVDVTKGRELPFRRAAEAMQLVSATMKQRDNQLNDYRRAVGTLTTEKLALHAENVAMAAEIERLQARLAATETEYSDYQRRAVSFVQFVETRCAEFVDQEQRVEGAFLYQEASRTLGEELRMPSPRMDQFRASFPSAVRPAPVAEASRPISVFGGNFQSLYSDSDLGN